MDLTQRTSPNPFFLISDFGYHPPTMKVVTHNTQDLNSPVKQQKIFQYYHSQKADAILLQETHFPRHYKPSFLQAKFLTFNLANAEDETKGVVIIFSHRCKFTLLTEFKDPEGRFLLVKQIYTFISYYAPNKGQAHFF